VETTESYPSKEPKQTSPWVYLGVGCGIAGLLLMAVAVTAVYYIYRTAKNVHAEMADPATREAQVMRILGTEKIPDGYKANVSLSIPWILDLAILSDKEFSRHQGDRPFDKRGFVYVKTLRGRGNKRAKDYFEGTEDPSDFLSKSKIDLSRGKEIGRGSIEMPNMTLYYLANEGGIRIKGERMEGLTTMIFIDCPNDNRFRMGIWFGPKGEGSGEVSSQEGSSGSGGAWNGPGTNAGSSAGSGTSGSAAGSAGQGAAQSASPPAGGSAATSAASAAVSAERDLAGTPADAAAIKDFMSHFDPCR
jgi:hypothetical protein